ncbi:MAG: hypoxanthine phosphoribosyltransferase [Candidatus Gastranaerophilales bacterium]|nr:hypoxanthine phosphoribosyltransferase [Candidatus Gastranaerophilales bacterium]
MNEPKVLIDTDSLYRRIKELANEINNHFGTEETLNVICVLKGAAMFCTELSKNLKMPLKFEYITLSSYGNSTSSSGKVKSLNMNLPDFKGENVLIVEDIIDTGLTLSFLIDYIHENCSPKDTKLAVMFDKKIKREYNLSPDFSAFEVDNKFIVGFGLDYQGFYRNLDYIGYFDN